MSSGNYREALEAAGAVVHEFKSFGSYQGDWWAKVTFAGTVSWVNGSYGSCSGCDAFESEFGYYADRCEEHRYDEVAGCTDCAAQAVTYQQRLSAFGLRYLSECMTQAEAETAASRYLEWDDDAQAMVDWLKSHR